VIVDDSKVSLMTTFSPIYKKPEKWHANLSIFPLKIVSIEETILNPALYKDCCSLD